MSPKVGGVYKVSYKGVTYPNFKVERIARLRNGCVLAYGYRKEIDTLLEKLEDAVEAVILVSKKIQ